MRASASPNQATGSARERGLHGEPLRLLREHGSRPVLERLRACLIEIQNQVFQKQGGPSDALSLKNWTALTRYCENPDLSNDNNATERTLRCFAVGRANWTFSAATAATVSRAAPPPA
jgi:transposase